MPEKILPHLKEEATPSRNNSGRSSREEHEVMSGSSQKGIRTCRPIITTGIPEQVLFPPFFFPCNGAPGGILGCSVSFCCNSVFVDLTHKGKHFVYVFVEPPINLD